MIDDKDLDEALDRIARTADGELLYRYFQKVLMGTLADHGPDESALRTEHGRRRFAQELMARLAKGIDESGGSGSTDSGQRRSERIVVFSAKQPSGAGRRISVREHFAEHDPELQRLRAVPDERGD